MSSIISAGVSTAPIASPPAPQPTPTTASGSGPRPSTLEELQRRTTHLVQAPSGGWYRIIIPDLAFMLSHGEIPDNLRRVAILEVMNDSDEPLATRKKEDGTPLLDLELVRDFYDLRAMILVAAIVEPRVTLDDLAKLPTEDKDMLQAIATRQRFFDARGVRLGVEPLDKWEPFPRWHECPEGCEKCAASRRELSTVDVG